MFTIYVNTSISSIYLIVFYYHNNNRHLYVPISLRQTFSRKIISEYKIHLYIHYKNIHSLMFILLIVVCKIIYNIKFPML